MQHTLWAASPETDKTICGQVDRAADRRATEETQMVGEEAMMSQRLKSNSTTEVPFRVQSSSSLKNITFCTIKIMQMKTPDSTGWRTHSRLKSLKTDLRIHDREHRRLCRQMNNRKKKNVAERFKHLRIKNKKNSWVIINVKNCFTQYLRNYGFSSGKNKVLLLYCFLCPKYNLKSNF